MKKIGLVVIGRNEGERLIHCLQSVLRQGDVIVYVDSDSSDNSVAFAEKNNIPTIQLNTSVPLSAARARNEGFAHLVQQHPDLHYVQFIDGDCELYEGWLDTARTYLEQHEQCGIVAGRTVEKFPQSSIYNLLCDLEWRTGLGNVNACGGIFLIRQELFRQIGGFNQNIIAGEEPEMCHRLRMQGWQVHQLDQPMVRHDADMKNLFQWWRRAVRSGYGYAHALTLYGYSQGLPGWSDSLRIWLWGGAVPGGIALLAILLDPWFLLLVTVYPVQISRVAAGVNGRFGNWQHSFLYALFIMLAKWPQLYGQIIFWLRKVMNGPLKLIEYK